MVFLARPALLSLVMLAVLATTACASGQASHGRLTTLSQVEGTPEVCIHRVPEQVCVKHHPELEPRFKTAGDWCGEHGIPESQCLECHPDLSFSPLPALAPAADLAWLSKQGEDVPSLAEHAVVGKVTVFDFYADWCAPCRKLDEHVYRLLQQRGDIALRKLNIVSWETPVAKRYLSGVSTLPHLVIHGKDARLVRTLTGLDLPALDQAISEGASR
jgi:thiol-disulfide isomerase/thioredoxin